MPAVPTQTPAFTRTKASYDDYLALPDSAHIVEWANGEIITHMPPTDQHQDLARFLAVLIDSFVRTLNLGMLRFAPFEIKLWPEGPSREPDILFVSTEHRDRLTEKRVVGAPDLVVETVSPGTAKIDRVDKFLEYQQVGVREYWIVDPRRYRQQADFYLLDDGVYHATVLPGLWLRLDWLWQDPLPNPQVCLAQVLATAEDVPTAVKAAYQALYQAFTSDPSGQPQANS